jgi:hypothetical protein
VGRIGPGDAWVGFGVDGADYHLVLGAPDGERRVPADAGLLLALAIAYFEEALGEPPVELEATHQDMAALVRHVASGEADPARRRLLDEAVDAIDDGLGADAVAGRLAAAMPGTPNEQADPVDLLVMRARSALEG